MGLVSAALLFSLFVPLYSTAQTEGPSPAAGASQKLAAADQLVDQKQYADAIRAFKELLEQDPRNVQLLNRLGIAYQAQQNFHQAQRYYERAVKADRKFAPAVNNLGSVYYNDKRYAKAIRQYRRAIQLDSTVASFYSNLGYAYLGEKKYDEMMTAFRQALALDPDILQQHGRTGTVVLERSVQDHGAFFFYLAKTYAQMGDGSRCAEYLKKARDEGYKDIDTVRTDPVFAPVLASPAVKEFLDTLVPTPAPHPSGL
jgi:tetratricopeptide (TPR) repeat protein